MICKNCGKEFEGNFCPECGTTIADETQQKLTNCPRCGTKRVDNGKFCANCGFNYADPSQSISIDSRKINVANNFKKAFAKAYRWILACGMLVMGAASLLCLLSPTIVEEAFGQKNYRCNGYVAIFNRAQADVKELSVYASIALFSVALFCVLYGFIQLILAIKSPYSKIKNKFMWILDGVISLALIVVGILVSTQANSNDYWGGKLGVGFAMCVVMGVFGLILLFARIFYELKVFKLEDVGFSEEQISYFNNKKERKIEKKEQHKRAKEEKCNKISKTNRRRILIIVISCLAVVVILTGTLVGTLYPFSELKKDGILYKKFGSHYEIVHGGNKETLNIASSIRGVKVIGIGSWSCNGNNKLKRVTISDNITSIGDGAFSNCINLTSINITNNVKIIGDKAFGNCNNLKSIFIPSSVETIKSNAFIGCENLTIYCEASSQPIGWDNNWNYLGGKVMWGQKSSDVK